MNTIFKPLSALLLPAYILASCQNGTDITYEKASWADSTDYAYVNVDLELPASGNDVANAIREDLVEIMNLQVENALDESYNAPTDGTTLTVNEQARTYGTSVLEVYTIESKKLNDFRFENDPDTKKYPPIPYSADFILEKAYATEHFVVFHNTNSIYCGGAHPSETGAGYLTYNLTDGSRLTEVIDSTRLKDLQPILRAGLQEYFTQQTGGEKVNLDELLLLDSALVPLPTRLPSPAPEGLRFEYMQYEIAPYAAGMPTFTVPYKKIEPYLMPEAKELLKGYTTK